LYHKSFVTNDPKSVRVGGIFICLIWILIGIGFLFGKKYMVLYAL